MSGSNRAKIVAYSLALQLFLYGSGMVALVWLNGTFGVSRYLYILLEIPNFLLGTLVVVSLAMAAYLLSGSGVRALANLNFERIPVGLIAIATAVISVIATNVFYHGYALSMDEWMPRLQAELFRSGRLVGQIPAEWMEYGRSMFHVFATYDPTTGEIASNYRPGMAAIFAMFDVLGIGIYSSAIMNAGAVLLVALVTRQIYPSSRSAPVVAAILLATSQQALAASLTSYAMTGHLFFNLLWLHLFLRNFWWSHLLAAVVGVITASLHQVHLHVFFALPFLLTLLRPIRPGVIATYFVIYLFGHLAVLSWDRVLIQQVAVSTGSDAKTTLDNISAIVRIPDLADMATVWANLVRLIAWQNMALIPLILVFWMAGAGNRWTRLLVFSLVVSLLPYPILMPDQGHGWGYRYLHGLLGHFAILAAIGWTQIGKAVGTVRDRAFAILLMVISPIALLPLRAAGISDFITPYSAATTLTMTQDADVVVVDTPRIFVGVDILRNNPTDLRHPIAMNLRALSTEQVNSLCQKYKVKFLSFEDYKAIGVRTFSSPRNVDPETYQANVDALNSKACQSAG